MSGRERREEGVYYCNCRILSSGWGFTCHCEACLTDPDRDVRNFLTKLRQRMRETLCGGDLSQVYRYQVQKLKSVAKMKTRNHNELLNSHQARVVLAVLSRQDRQTVLRALEDWREFCQSDRLHESRRNYQEVSSSFENGEPRNKLEFFDEKDQARAEWVKWIYSKL